MLFNYPTIVTECTHLYKQAQPKNKIGTTAEEEDPEEFNTHTCWDSLYPIGFSVFSKWFQLHVTVKRNKGTTFVLIHFSLRHKESEIKSFFQDVRAQDPELTNIIPWTHKC